MMSESIGGGLAKQEAIDTFYWKHAPCCAGCDWWCSFNSSVGECTKSAPAPDSERWAMLEMSNVSVAPSSGHIVTLRQHHCGDFKDEFDWFSLPVAYRARIGAPNLQRSSPHD